MALGAPQNTLSHTLTYYTNANEYSPDLLYFPTSYTVS